MQRKFLRLKYEIRERWGIVLHKDITISVGTFYICTTVKIANLKYPPIINEKKITYHLRKKLYRFIFEKFKSDPYVSNVGKSWKNCRFKWTKFSIFLSGLLIPIWGILNKLYISWLVIICLFVYSIVLCNTIYLTYNM